MLTALMAFVAWRVVALGREREVREAAAADALALRLEARMTALVAEQHRAMLRDLLDNLQKQMDRLVQQDAELAERLRRGLAAELSAARDARQNHHLALQTVLAEQREEHSARFMAFAADTRASLEALRAELLEKTLTTLSEHARADRELLQTTLAESTQGLVQRIDSLTRTVDERLEILSGKVGERLEEGFRKTNETFASVMARLATIDEAQKKIDGLTTNVVSLQELLGDKKSRGAFGEVQLEALVRNILPSAAYEFQYGLPNGNRADCVLRLPEPTGLVAVDAKFPLENYRRMFDSSLSEADRGAARTAFRADIRRHVDAISGKYLIPDVTSDGAVMFVPAEAVFAEIHAYHAEVVEYAQQKRVWIVSPTTLMAILNTARAVLKDVETRQQVHVIQEALGRLAKDFSRFDARMKKLADHIRQAHEDAQDVHISSRKISSHFARIEGARLDDDDGELLPAYQETRVEI